MKKELTTNAYAKINLYLHVTGTRDDGYHLIESVMQSVSLADGITVTADTDARGKRIGSSCSDERIPLDGNNIAVKCAAAFFEHFGIDNYSLDIRIDKKIPISGGLAGGSTDGAAVLKLLDKIYETDAGEDKLCSLGAKIGADIPFCVIGGTALCEGIGEKVTPLYIPSPQYSVLIVSPGGSVSTPDAYRAIDEYGDITAKYPISEVVTELVGGTLPRSLHNDFETVILPANDSATLVKQKLVDLGAFVAQMSGSGPTVFGLFESEEKCGIAAEKLEEIGFSAFVCRAI